MVRLLTRHYKSYVIFFPEKKLHNMEEDNIAVSFLF